MSYPNVISGQAIGTALTVFDETALAALNIQGVAVGSTAWVLQDSHSFILSQSNASLVPGQVVAVNGVDGLRWLLNTSIPGTPLNTAQQYVAKTGSDSNDGLSWATAKKTGYAAYNYIQANKGGTIYLGDDCTWVDNANLQPGQVLNQGAWFCLAPGQGGPGFQTSTWPCIILGAGSGESLNAPTPFQQPGTVVLRAGSNLPSDYRHKPAIWKVGCLVGPTFYNIQTAPMEGTLSNSVGNYYSIRDGWDYNRNTDGSLMYQTVSSSSRSAGSTTHTVTCSPPANITSAKRVYNGGDPSNPANYTTTLTITSSGSGLDLAAPPWSIGVKVWFHSTSGSFNSGAYQVLTVNVTQLSNADWTVTFTGEGNAVVGPTLSPGTLTSVVAAQGDLIDLESTNSQFPSTQYLVTGTTITGANSGTITVKDVYGGMPGIPATASASNIGNLVHQERSMFATVASNYVNVNNRAPTTDTNDDAFFRYGPGIDFAAQTAFVQQLSDSYIEGYKPSVASGFSANYDDLRQTAVLLFGGAITAPGAKFKNLTGSQAGFRCVFTNEFGAGSLGVFDLDNFIPDSPNGEMPFIYSIDGNSGTIVNIRNVEAADFNAGYGPALNRIVGVPPLNISGDISAVGNWASVAPQMGTVHGVGVQGFTSGTPWTLGQPATWTQDLQISGKHPAAWRQVSPVNRRFTEYAKDQSLYEASGPQTTGVADPLGGTGAVSYDDTAGNIVIHSFDHTFTFAVGDRIKVSGWVNADGQLGFFGQSNLFGVTAVTGNVTWASTGTTSWSAPPPVFAAGWQYVTFYDTVISHSGGGTNISVRINGPAQGRGGHMALFKWSVEYLPVTIPEVDAAEYSGTSHAVPHNLPVGMGGTFEGQKFLANGGLATATANALVIGASSGQVTLGGSPTNALPLYAADGTTIIGWLPLYAGTVH